MYNFTIKSIFHDYSVTFTTDSAEVLRAELKEGDYIIIDNKVLSLYPAIFSNLPSKTRFIGIDATEKQKSYEGVIPVIRDSGRITA